MNTYCIQGTDTMTGTYWWLVSANTESDAMQRLAQTIGSDVFDVCSWTTVQLSDVLSEQYRGVAELHGV